jgi:hypothetical protein
MSVVQEAKRAALCHSQRELTSKFNNNGPDTLVSGLQA